MPIKIFKDGEWKYVSGHVGGVNPEETPIDGTSIVKTVDGKLATSIGGYINNKTYISRTSLLKVDEVDDNFFHIRRATRDTLTLGKRLGFSFQFSANSVPHVYEGIIKSYNVDYNGEIATIIGLQYRDSQSIGYEIVGKITLPDGTSFYGAYVDDEYKGSVTGDANITLYKISEDKEYINSGVIPIDGVSIKIDANGNIYAVGGSGVEIVTVDATFTDVSQQKFTGTITEEEYTKIKSNNVCIFLRVKDEDENTMDIFRLGQIAYNHEDESVSASTLIFGYESGDFDFSENKSYAVRFMPVPSGGTTGTIEGVIYDISEQLSYISESEIDSWFNS